MAFVEEATAIAYREAWDAWRKQVDHVHRVFLDDEPIMPDQMKGLLNREARTKAAYDSARLRLLGLDVSPTGAATGDSNPFR